MTAKKTAARKITAVKEPMTKSAFMEEIAQNTELTKKQVSSVFDELVIVIERHIKKRAPGQFTLPGLMKIEVKKKPATKAQEGINPRTREKSIFSINRGKCLVIQLFWIPAFAGMTCTYLISSFPRRRESRSYYPNLLSSAPTIDLFPKKGVIFSTH